MRTYTLRVTFQRPGENAKVQNVRGLEWPEAMALENVLRNEPTTVRVDTTVETPAWAR